jgi:intein/homing endonuclease
MEVEIINYLELLAMKGYKFSVRGVNEIFEEMWHSLSPETKERILKETSEKLKVKIESIRNYIYKKRPIPLELVSSIVSSLSPEKQTEIWSKIFKKFSTITYSHSKSVKLPKVINEDLVYLIGALRDAYIREKGSTYYILFGYLHEDRVWIDNILDPIFEKLFGEKLKKIGVKREYKLITSKAITSFLKETFNITPGSQRNWKTPEIVLRLPLELQKHYIAGFWDADGGCPHEETYSSKWFKPYVKFTQSFNNENSCPPLEDIQRILEVMNITSTITKLPRHGSRKSPAFDLIISKKESIINFWKEIPVRHPIKAQRLKNLVNFLGLSSDGEHIQP